MNKIGRYPQTFFSTSWPVWQYENQAVIQAPTPPPLSFTPLAPLSESVWLAYLFTFLSFLFFVTFSLPRRHANFAKMVLKAIDVLKGASRGFGKLYSLGFIWPFWFLLLGSFFKFYTTYILSAVLHPFSIPRPISTCSELADELIAGRYKIISYKNPASMPGCYLSSDQKSKDIAEAVKKNGYKYIPNAAGRELFSAIAEQDPESKSKLVLDSNLIFISLYLNEYPDNRDRL